MRKEVWGKQVRRGKRVLQSFNRMENFGAHHHYGEEDELVPSGTILQAACSMRCVYCQNAPESVSPELGVKWSVEEVVKWIEKMKKEITRNINWVGGSPTP
jgi:putative pyruvate formate lyase activating enzyme